MQNSDSVHGGWRSNSSSIYRSMSISNNGDLENSVSAAAGKQPNIFLRLLRRCIDVDDSMNDDRSISGSASYAASYWGNRTTENHSVNNNAYLARSRSIHSLPRNILTPDNRLLIRWESFILLLASYSSLVTPFEFGFYVDGVPNSLMWVDIVVNIFFIIDLILTFFKAYHDKKTYSLICDRKMIAQRYFKTYFLIDFLALIPWDPIYKAAGSSGAAEILRWMIWFRVTRAIKVDNFLKKLERDIRLSYFGVRILKLLAVEIYVTHVAGCFFYFLATTIPTDNEDNTWIGSLTLGGNSYENFRDINIMKRYVTSLYWAVVTMATLGYGDIHPVNPREMIFCMAFITFDMLLSAYLIGNITALIVKGSNTEKYREKMSTLIKYMNKNHVPQGLRHQMRQHLRVQFETEKEVDNILFGFPLSIRQKVLRALFNRTIENCYLFKNCSHEFINQIVSRAHPEYYLPQEVVVQQKDAADNLYIIHTGLIEEISIGREGNEEILTGLGDGNVFGEIAMICNIPQPFSARVKELSHILRIDKQSFNMIIATYILDGRQIVNNLLERTKDGDDKIQALASDIKNMIAYQESELTMNVINTASRGDIEHLKNLIKAGANPSKPDYDGRTPLHLAASKGFDDLMKMLIREGVDVNCKDNFGTTPLLEALRAGFDNTAKILVEAGGQVSLEEAGTDLCNAVIHGNTGLLQRLLDHGVDPNSADYDLRTPLHIASAEGFLIIAKMLVAAGADIFAKDRWGNTALDEARRCGSQPIVLLLEEAAMEKLGGVFSSPNATQFPSSDALPSPKPSLFLPLAENSQDNIADSSPPPPPTISSLPPSITLSLPPPAIDTEQKEEEETKERQSRDEKEEKEEKEKEKVSTNEDDFKSGKFRVERKDEINTESFYTPPLPNLKVMSENFPRPSATSNPLANSLPPTPHSFSSPLHQRGSGSSFRGYRSSASVHALSQQTAKKRVTLYPYHPWNKVKKCGRVFLVPSNVEELLKAAKQQFNGDFHLLLNKDGGEIATVDLIFDGDRLFVVNDANEYDA